jgi:hypothetical protein
VALPCEAQSGSFCPAGSSTASGEPCPAGNFCDGGVAGATTCSASPGSYCARGGSQAEGVVCLAGHYCPGGSSDKVPCKLPAGGGRRLLDFEDLMEMVTAEDTTMLAAADTPPGHYCPAGTEAPAGALCPEGYYCLGGPNDKRQCDTQPGFFCPAGCSSPEGTPCPANSYCSGGASGPVECNAPAGRFCPEGSTSSEGSPCLPGKCCDGGSAPPARCPAPPHVGFIGETPPPFMLNWWVHRDAAQGVSQDPAYQSVSREGDTAEDSFLQGHINLPVDGRWLVSFDFYVPKFDAGSSPFSIFPEEAIGAVSEEDVIDCTINGVQKTLTTSQELSGHKQALQFEIEGQVLDYHFTFHSPTIPAFTHPFVTAAEVSLLRDRNEAPPAGQTAQLWAKAIDAVDGSTLKKGAKVSNGYKKKAWTIETDPTISIFKGTTLIAAKPMPKVRNR